MKFSGIFALSLAAVPVFGAAVAEPDLALDAGAPLLVGRATSKQNGAVILSKSVQRIDKGVLVLDKAIAAVKSSNISNDQLNDLLNGADFLYTTLQNETVVAKKSPTLDEQCTDYVQYFVNILIKDSQKLSKDSITFKPYIYGYGLGDAFVSIVGSLKDAADAYANVLISKVPASRKAVAKKDKAAIDKAFQAVVDAPVPT